MNSDIDIIDLKDPSKGALGKLNINDIENITNFINKKKLISSTIGDLPNNKKLIYKNVDELSLLNIDFIKKRRWNILLKNNIILKLSEENPYESIENYTKILKNLSEAQINNILSIDLRNITKSIIKFKND